MKKENRSKSRKQKKSHSEKIVIFENKKRFEEIKSEEKKDIPEENEEEEAGILQGFQLPSSARRSLENIRAGQTLEGSVIFAPRLRDKKFEGKNYAEKYDVKYEGSKYGEKTPNLYAESQSTQGESKEKNSNNIQRV